MEIDTAALDDSLRDGLRECMAVAGMLNYREVAVAAGLDVRSVKYFGGQSTVLTASKLAKGLGCKPSDLFGAAFRRARP